MTGETTTSNSNPTAWLQSNIAEFAPNDETWTVWKEKLDLYFSEIACTRAETKKAILLRSIGSGPYNLLHSLCNPEKPSAKTFEELCKLLETHYTPPTIVFHERKVFYTTIRNTDEPVSDWYARLKRLAINCKFGGQLDSFVLDKFIIGLPEKIYSRLCEEDENITLANALKKAMILETKYANKQPNVDSNEVNYMKKNYKGRNNKAHSNNWNNGNSNNNYNGETKSKTACTHCGWKNHASNACKFKSAKCNFCGKTGHLASICNSKHKDNEHKAKNNVNFVSDSEDNNDFVKNSFDYSIFSINSNSTSEIYGLLVDIDGKKLELTCDTGAPCTLIPYSLFKKLYRKQSIKRCSVPYVDYNGQRINLCGEYNANITYRGVTKKICVVVTNTNNTPLLGRTFLRAFNFQLVQVNAIAAHDKHSVIVSEIKNEFFEVFESGLGKCTISTISLPLVDNFKPIFCKPRPLPLAWKAQIEKQIKKLIEIDVLESIDNPDWGTPLVPILKPNGDIRICGDYKVTLNRFLVEFHYPLPRIDEIFASLEGGELFTKLDLSNAYNQLALDEKSQLLCAWSTHLG